MTTTDFYNYTPSPEVQASMSNAYHQAQLDVIFTPKPATKAPPQRDEAQLSRMLVHHIRQATAGGAERRY